MDTFGQVHSPESLAGEELDAYLELGWFRMGQTIFTTNFLNFKNQFYSAIWLRVVLSQFADDKTQQKLKRKNAAFKTQIGPAVITPEKELLFARYKDSVPFEASASLHQLLFGNLQANIYDTKEINIFDGDRLIGCGFFDMGKESAAGINSFYDPAYKKYSIGKHLIYLKMSYCKECGLRYFYPGYFVPGYPFFDYKLSLGRGAIQFFHLRSQEWLSIDHFSPESDVFCLMQSKLSELQNRLTELHIVNNVVRYEYFYANLTPELSGAALFDYPIFLYCADQAEDRKPLIVVFDVRDEKYHVLRCFSVWTPTSNVDAQQDTYTAHLLKSGQDLVATRNPEDITQTLWRELQIKT
jgi:leucyl-tRNA---protein transferase